MAEFRHADSLRSRTVAVLKITLPLTALALMSTVFLFARAPVPEGTIPYAEIEAIAQDPRLSGAQISGVSDSGAIIEINAENARPDGNKVRIENLSAVIMVNEGVETRIMATEGEVDSIAQAVRIFGLARVTTSSGYEMETNDLRADLETGTIQTDSELAVRAPFGSLTAGSLRVTNDGEGGQTMLFGDGVRLLYTPQPED